MKKRRRNYPRKGGRRSMKASLRLPRQLGKDLDLESLTWGKRSDLRLKHAQQAALSKAGYWELGKEKGVGAVRGGVEIEKRPRVYMKKDINGVNGGLAITH